MYTNYLNKDHYSSTRQYNCFGHTRYSGLRRTSSILVILLTPDTRGLRQPLTCRLRALAPRTLRPFQPSCALRVESLEPNPVAAQLTGWHVLQTASAGYRKEPVSYGVNVECVELITTAKRSKGITLRVSYFH
jgi:hypothetical protein